MSLIVDAQHLGFEYPGRRALDDISFELVAGSVTALVGPNGAGKATLMRCLCGLNRPLAGRIHVDGIDVVEEPRRCHQRIGFLPDFVGLYDPLTVAQCLQYHAAANGVTRALPARIAATAQQLKLTERLSQPVGELSRGLRQRVAIGQAIIHAPALLILDEPAAGLDPEARHSLAQLFRALRARGMSLLVSSHILAELEVYATHMLVLKDGRLIEHRVLGGTPDLAELEIEVLVTSAALAPWLETREIGDVPRFSNSAAQFVQFQFTARLVAGGCRRIRGVSNRLSCGYRLSSRSAIRISPTATSI